MKVDRRMFLISTAVGTGVLAHPGLVNGEESALNGTLARVTGPDAVMPSLPQKDKNPDARRGQIDRRRPDYEYIHASLAPLGLLKKLPDRSGFSREYLSGRAKKFVNVVSNNLKNRASMTFRRLKLKTPEDYAKLFPDMDNPSSIDHWMKDSVFAEQRLSGANPMVIRRLPDLNGLSGVIPGQTETWEQAFGENRLFVCDYRVMPPIRGGKTKGRQKYMPKPVAYFVLTTASSSGKGRLMPAAIRIADSGPLLTPQSQPTEVWQYAKTCVQIADGNHHEMSTHLGRTHFVMEPFAVSAERQLADLHPLKVLLDEHFRFMLANNELGRERLVNKGGIVDSLLAGTIEESLSIVKWAANSYSVSDNSFHQDLKNRGLDDTESFPHFPYRDDALLLHAEMRRFIKAYIDLYYSSDADVAADWEVQAWIAEVGTKQGGGLSGIKAPLRTVESLVDMITHVVFTCSAEHAAVNYSQWDWMAFVPNMPLASYKKIAPDGNVKKFMEILPTGSAAREQVDVMATLTKYQYDKLGEYTKDTFADKRAANLGKEFLKNLGSIEQKIIERNKTRLVPYEFLRPSLIPNGTSI